MSFTRLRGLGVVTFTMNDISVIGSDGWSYNIKAAFQRELATELAHPPITDAHTIVGMMIGITDNDYRTRHGVMGTMLSDFGAFANSGAFQAHFNPLSDQWFAAQVGGASTLPVITSFTATPSTITKGQVSYLDWSVSGPITSVSIDRGIGVVQNNTRHGVVPDVTTTYTLTARGPGGTSTRSVTVTVQAQTAGGGTGSGSSCVGHGESGGISAVCCAGLTRWTYDANSGNAFSGIQCWDAPCAAEGQWAGPGGVGNYCCPPLVNVNGKCAPAPAGSNGGGGFSLGGSSGMLVIAGIGLIALMMMKRSSA